MSPGGREIAETRIATQLAEFLDSGRWKSAGIRKEAAGGVLRTFLEICYRELGIPPEKLDEPELHEALLERLPAKLGSKEEGAAQAPALVGDYLAWLGEQHLNPNAWKFGAIVEQATREFPSLLKKLGGTAVKSGPSEPFVRPGSKVGRNDPCPCGSGKKYKKCCSS